VEEKKILCRASWRKTHGKQDLCRVFYFGRMAKFFLKAMLHLFGVWKRKKSLSCVMEKTHRKQDLCRAFYFGRTAKGLFAVHPIKNAW
jgi:hypothetical protein